jgi:hypothetical protein
VTTRQLREPGRARISLSGMRTLIRCSLLAAAALAVLSSTSAQAGRTAAIAHPAGSSAVVLQVESGGGFVAPQATLGRLPAFTLYGDGTVIVPGAVPQISPGPAISPLLRRHLSERRVQMLLRGAQQAGLFGRGAISYGDMGTIGVSDAPTTTIRLNAAGRRIVRSAYALGMTAGSSRLPPAQAKARRALASFIAGLPHGLAGARYVPRAVAVYVSPFRGPAQPGSSPIAWPLASDLGTAGRPSGPGSSYRCIAVRGGDARALLARLRSANDQSRWIVRGKPATAYALVFRPLLPDERSCSSLA